MVVAICVEASHRRGAGHLFRAMVLAKELLRLGRRALLVINDSPQAIEKLRESGFEYLVAPVGSGRNWESAIISQWRVDIWINDRLDTDTGHGMAVKAQGVRLVTFDDLGGGAACADLNICALACAAWIPGGRVLSGGEWLVLDPDLASYRRQRTLPERLLVTLGGSDTHGVTLRIVRLLQDAGRSATLLTGPLFDHRAELEAIIAGGGIDWRSGIACMGELFFEHDLAITGGGITSLEAVATGLPIIAVANEVHEIPVAERLEKLGCARFAGYHEQLDEGALLAIPDDIHAMSAAGMKSISVDAVTRVCEEILRG